MPTVSPSDGPVAVTGAAGYIGCHTVHSFAQKGYTVRACVRDANAPDKVDHLKAMNEEGLPGTVEIVEGNILEAGSYDGPFSECSAVLHVGTPMLYGGQITPRECYDGMVEGIFNVLNSATKAGTVKRFVYTSSFAAIGHPAPSGYVYTEEDWADSNRERDRSWNPDAIDKDGGVAYAWAKVETERLVNKYTEENVDYDAVSICPCVVLGPLLTTAHEGIGSWQWALARMLEGKPCPRGWQALWNIVDVRDVGEAEALVVESENVQPSSRYQLTATDQSGELNVDQLHEHLQNLFPDLTVGGRPDAMAEFLERRGSIHDGPRAYCTKAIDDLGLSTQPIEDTLKTTGETMIELGLCKP
ncbi:MAG: NAD-dependent epimerase/dehydratase family protein [Gammaproteobacteria bacterium]|nr:NAD-dependent epimerase/dehydratase family protein [Gammaproteobacteria bacterium]